MTTTAINHPAFCSLQKLSTEISNAVPDPFAPKTLQQLVVGGLCHKIFSHCHMVKHLAQKQHLAEAIILLRATYESVIIALYLSHHDEEIEHYQNHSSLIEAKDLMVSHSRANESDKEAFKETIEQLKQEIHNKNLLDESRYFKRGLNRDPQILEEPDQFARIMNVHFKDIREMRDDLKITDARLYSRLKDLDFQIYNYGSQLSHSYWHCVNDYFVRPEKPAMNAYQTLLYTLVALDAMVTALETIQMLCSTREKLDPFFKNVGTELERVRPQTEIKALPF